MGVPDFQNLARTRIVFCGLLFLVQRAGQSVSSHSRIGVPSSTTLVLDREGSVYVEAFGIATKLIVRKLARTPPIANHAEPNVRLPIARLAPAVPRRMLQLKKPSKATWFSV